MLVSKKMAVRKVGKYEVGRTIGEGNFAKVKFAQNTETGESVAMKVLDRNTIIKHKMIEQVQCITTFLLVTPIFSDSLNHLTVIYYTYTGFFFFFFENN